MEKYSGTAERIGAATFPDDLGMYGHRKSVDRAFKRIMNDGKENFLPGVTGQLQRQLSEVPCPATVRSRGVDPRNHRASPRVRHGQRSETVVPSIE